jgi:hypothetical protein
MLVLLFPVTVSAVDYYEDDNGIYKYQQASHPRIFFSEEDIPALRQQAQTTHAEIYQPIKNYADNNLYDERPCDGAAGEVLEGPCDEAAKLLLSIAFTYVITGDQLYFDRARDYLITYSQSTTWGDRDHGHHHMLLAFVIAYDWLYNDLSTADRTTIQNALIQRTGESYEAASSPGYVSDWNNWWRFQYLHNHWSNNVGALGVASLVLEGEHSEATTWLDYAIAEYQKDSHILSGIQDGTWHESLRYQAFKFQKSLPFYYNLERIKGINLIPDEFFENYIYWRIYNYLPGTEKYAFTFADVWPNTWFDYAPYSILRFMASRYDNGYAEWMAQHILAQPGSRDSYWVPYGVYEFFYYDPTVTPTPPTDLPLDRTFDDLGIVTWRTGWGDNDLVFGIKSSAYGGRFGSDSYFNGDYPYDDPEISYGTHTGHDHPDANTFYLYKGSTDLATEKDRYQVFVTSNHNTILVDQEGQYRPRYTSDTYADTDGKITAVYETSDFNYVVADATNTYRERDLTHWNYAPGDWKITEFTRHVIFAKPDYLVMVDNLRSDTDHRYDWIYHVSESGSISVENNWIKGDANGNDILGINVLSPSGFLYETGDSDGKPYIRTRPPTNAADTRFINVLYPTTSSQWSNKPSINLLGNTDQGAGVRVSLDGNQDHIFRYGTAEEITIGEYTLRGEVASILRDGSGTLKKIFLGNGNLLSDANGNLVQSPDKKTFEAVYSGASLALHGNGLGGLTIYAPSVDVNQVTVNGQQTEAARNGDYITVSGSQAYHRADNNPQDGCIDLGEMLAFMNRWKVSVADVSMREMMGAIALWKAGTGCGSCTPTTCAELKYECGTPDDECGTELDCGTCGTHATCPSGTCVCESGWDDCNGDNSCECDLSSNSCVGGQCVEEGVVVALSCSQEAVQDAIDSAQDGDTVQVPAGTCTWDSMLVLDKSIKLVGAGIDNTILINEIIDTGLEDFLIQLSPEVPADNPYMEVTGFTLDANSEGACISISAPDDIYAFSNFRIHHNKIKNNLDDGDAYMSIRVKGNCFGLIDHNQFENNYYDFKIYGDMGNSWDLYPGLENIGTANYLYIEDNNFTDVGHYTLTSGEGARWVFRYNTMNNTDDGASWDAHGDTRNRGVVAHEIYENTIINEEDPVTGTCAGHDYRGGTGIIFNNNLTCGTSGVRCKIKVREEHDSCTYSGGCDGSPCGDEVNNGYIWNNRNTRDNNIIAVWEYDDYNCIDEDDAWWDDAESSSGGESPSNFYYDISSNRPSTCTIDDVYWETDNRRLYRCTTIDTWTFVYTPYTYPHPLTQS